MAVDEITAIAAQIIAILNPEFFKKDNNKSGRAREPEMNILMYLQCLNSQC